MELNQQQKELVEKNIKLVYKIAQKLNIMNNQDAIQEGIMGLCIASKRYDENVSRFSTFATSYIKGYILTYLNTNSLIRPVRHCGKFIFEDVSLYDEEFIYKNTNEFSEVDFKSCLEDILNKTDDDTKIIIQMLLEGYTQIEIAEKLGFTQPLVHRRIKNIRKLLTEEFYGN